MQDQITESLCEKAKELAKQLSGLTYNDALFVLKQVKAEMERSLKMTA